MKLILNEAQIKHIISELAISSLRDEEKNINVNPTELQKKAGNYKMGHVTVCGMKITIENPKGSYRKWKGGQTLMKNSYGYFKTTKGKDGDHVDVFLGDELENIENVFVVDQNNPQREFDESKVMLGFKTEDEAKKAYLSNYDKNWKGFRKITGVPMDVFKEWLYRGRKQRQPFGDYILIKNNKVKKN